MENNYLQSIHIIKIQKFMFPYCLIAWTIYEYLIFGYIFFATLKILNIELV